MGVAWLDRVQQTSTTTGTGNLTLLAGVPLNKRPWSLIGVGNFSYGFAASQTTGNMWEINTFTLQNDGTLARGATPLASSNAGALVNFDGSVLDVMLDIPASLVAALPYLNVANTFTASPQKVTGSANAVNLSGSASTVAPSVLATGSDTDVSLKVGGQGHGFTQLGPDTYGTAFWVSNSFQLGVEAHRIAATLTNLYEFYIDTAIGDFTSATGDCITAFISTQSTATHDPQEIDAFFGIAWSKLPSPRTIAAIIGGNFQAFASASGTVTKARGVYAQVNATSGANFTSAYGVDAWIYTTTATSGVGTSYGYSLTHAHVRPSATHFGLWSDDMVTSPPATNSYFLWLDSPGVFRVKGDGVLAHYNANFTKYTPGATAFERVVIQWDLTHNVCEIGTEAGTTGGTLRALRLIGAGVQVAAESSTGPNASAAFEVDSVTQGFLPPRMSSAQKTAISSPAEGLTVYDTDLHAPCFWNGSVWKTIATV